ncbi:putative RNA recognition motif domain, WW domain, RNA-binding domain superfamily [Helianthus anomalus]
MDQHSNSPWSYDNSAPPPYHDGGPFNHGGHYNHHRRYQNNNYQDAGGEPSDSFGYSNGTAFSGRKRPFSQSVHGPPEFFDGGKCNKLYVSSVPREVTEEDIRSLFGEHGTITEVVLFKQLKNLQQHDCCFVKYATIEDASQAIKALNNQYTFPGRLRPIEVKYATKKPERPAPGFLKTYENKLLKGGHESQVFVGFLSKHASKAEIAEIFSLYGYVEDVYIFYDEQRRPRGTGFITFSDRAMAADAINSLNGKYVMKGCDQPLAVRFAEPRKPRVWENRYPPYFNNDPVAQTSLPNSSQMSSVSSACSGPTCMEMEYLPDCEWSEHICPDGNAYYYNCVTCESLWEKPEEYSYYEQQLENCNQQSNPTWVS